MKSTELRIGNYLFIPGLDRTVIVSAIFNSHFRCNDLNGIGFEESLRVNYQPITLTEEILLKCGFEKEIDNFIANDGFFTLSRDLHQFFYRDWLPISPEIKYLHQLQNLYFAQTNQELQINL